jgi:two-component system nitrate/nitrite response regulator NarP
MTKVLLADDHPMIASALDLLLRGTDYRLVGRARSGAEALVMIERQKPDLLLLDVNMPGLGGVEVLRELRAAKADVPTIFLTAGMDDAQLIGATELEPEGMILKTTDPALLLEAMDAVKAGGRWIDRELSDRATLVAERASARRPLSPRERELVELVRQGLRNRDIAERLGVTEGTVKVYLHGVFGKLGIGNRTELAIRAGEFLAVGAAQ